MVCVNIENTEVKVQYQYGKNISQNSETKVLQVLVSVSRLQTWSRCTLHIGSHACKEAQQKKHV